jgi:SAM-dependent methyltransferase
MKKKTLNQINELYTNNLKENIIHNSNTVGWPTTQSQYLRFDILNKVINQKKFIKQKNISISINDYGCGIGEHLVSLYNLQGIKINQYNGYDISSDMIKEAKKKLNLFDCKLNFFKSAQISTIASYTFVSGTFNVKFQSSNNDWKSYIIKRLENINKFSSNGFAFNMLSTHVDWKDKKLYYGDPSFFFNYCKKNFSKYVTLIHDYPLYEWTILVKKKI